MQLLSSFPKYILILVCHSQSQIWLKFRASKSREPPAKVQNIFDTVIGLSYTYCHNTLQTLNNLSVILNICHHPWLYSNGLIYTIPFFSTHEKGGFRGGLTSGIAQVLSSSKSGPVHSPLIFFLLSKEQVINSNEISRFSLMWQAIFYFVIADISCLDHISVILVLPVYSKAIMNKFM